MGELVAAALTKLRSNSLGQGGAGLDPVALARALLEMLDGRHLQIAVDDPALAGLLAEQGWDGGLRPPAEGDFLAAVDGNVGFNKANAAVRPELDYRVEPIDAGLAATLTITYTHTAPSGERACDRTPRYGDSYDEMIARCYWDYLRVYVPGGSELLEAEGLDGVTAGRGERDTTVFAGAFVLKPGEQHTVVLRYRLPSAVPSAPYRLAIRKQAGALAPPLRVAAGACRWETDLSRDRAFLCEVGVEYDNESED
jgi:hypothetical protein